MPDPSVARASLDNDIARLNAQDPGWIARKGAIPEVETEDDGTLFPDGRRAVECTSWAAYARRVHGARVEIRGFFCEDNPRARGMDRLAPGHDFAVLDGRWILDGWLANVEQEIDDPLIDMQDPARAELIERYYGDPARWERLSELEAEIDGEDMADLNAAMQGVCAPADIPDTPAMA